MKRWTLAGVVNHQFPNVYCSGRSPAVSQSKSRKSLIKDEEEDLTKDLDDPTPEPNIQEVNIPKHRKLKLY